MISTKELVIEEFKKGSTNNKVKELFPEIPERTLYSHKKKAKELLAEVQTTAINNSEIETPTAINVQAIAKHVCIVLVILLLSASFFTIQEVTSKIFAIASFSGYCIAIAITLTPLAVIFTSGNLYLRISIQIIAFCIEVLCNVVVIAQSTELYLKTDIANATGLSSHDFAWVAGVAIPFFALLCSVYLNQLQSMEKQLS